MTSKMKTRPQVLVRELRRSVYLKMKGYNSTETTYKHKLLKDILYNERSNLVANFKDFLIFDDSTEFLKRFYTKKEAIGRLPKIFDFYEVNSKIFPNYIILAESRYIYKNIQRKQKLIDYLQYLEERAKEKTTNKSSKAKPPKFFNSIEYDSIMKQSMFTAYENTESRIDASASFDNLIAAIDGAEKKVVSIHDQSESAEDGTSSKNSKPTPKLNKDLKSIDYCINVDDQQGENISGIKVKGLKKINKIVVEKLKSVAEAKENSKTLSNSNTKFNANDSIKSKEINNGAHHSKVLSMPKLTINNNIVNNITVINNPSSFGKSLTNFNKNLVNDQGSNVSGNIRNFDLGNKFNIINQKYTRNSKVNIAGSLNSQTHFATKPTVNTLEMAKEIISSQNRFLVTNVNKQQAQNFQTYVKQSVEPLQINKQPASMTSRKITGSVIDKNFQTIDVNSIKNINFMSNPLNNNEDVNHVLEGKKLKFIKINSNNAGNGPSGLNQPAQDSRRSFSVIKIPFLKDNKTGAQTIQVHKYDSHSIKRQVSNIPNYPLLKEGTKIVKPFSERGGAGSLKFLKGNK